MSVFRDIPLWPHVCLWGSPGLWNPVIRQHVAFIALIHMANQDGYFGVKNWLQTRLESGRPRWCLEVRAAS